MHVNISRSLILALFLCFVISASMLFNAAAQDDESKGLARDWVYSVGFIEKDGAATFDSSGNDIQTAPEQGYAVMAHSNEDDAMEIIRLSPGRKIIWNERYLFNHDLVDYNLTFEVPKDGSGNISINETKTVYWNFTWARNRERYAGAQMVFSEDGDVYVTAEHIHEYMNDPIIDENGNVSFFNDSVVNSSTSYHSLMKLGENGTITWEAPLSPLKYSSGLYLDSDGIINVYGPVDLVNSSLDLVMLQRYDADGMIIGAATREVPTDRSLMRIIPVTQNETMLVWTNTVGSRVWFEKTNDIGEEGTIVEHEFSKNIVNAELTGYHFTEDGKRFFAFKTAPNSSLYTSWILHTDGDKVAWFNEYASLPKNTTLTSMRWTEADELSCWASFSKTNGENELLFIKIDDSGSLISTQVFSNTGVHDLSSGMNYLGRGTYILFIVGEETHIMKTHPDPVFDSDHDGFYDPYEWDTFGSLDEAPDTDADGDGFTNQEELDEGTNPANEWDYPGQARPVYIILIIAAVVLFAVLIVLSLLFLKTKKKDGDDEKK